MSVPSADVLLSGPAGPSGAATALVLLQDGADLPRIGWVGPAAMGIDAADISLAVGTLGVAPSSHALGGRSVSLLPGVDQSWTGRPGLTGHRVGAADYGQDWAPSFRTSAVVADDDGSVRVEAADAAAGLRLTTELEAVAGGMLRIRHTVTNTAAEAYAVESLDVTVPLPDRAPRTARLHGPLGARAYAPAPADHRRFVAAREPRWPQRSRVGDPSARGHARLRVRPRRGLGRPRRLEREQPALPRATAVRAGDHARRRRAAAARRGRPG